MNIEQIKTTLIDLGFLYSYEYVYFNNKAHVFRLPLVDINLIVTPTTDCMYGANWDRTTCFFNDLTIDYDEESGRPVGIKFHEGDSISMLTLKPLGHHSGSHLWT